MMLDVVCEALDLESLLGIVHQSFLNQGEKEHGHYLVEGEVPAIADNVILQALLPGSLRQLTGDDLQSQFALTFALRHRLCYLNTLFHLQALTMLGKTFDFALFDNMFSRDVCDDRHALALMFAPPHWRNAANQPCLPIIGYSPVGIHILTRPVGNCRAFDRHDIKYCESKTESLFCEKHQDEAWWINTAEKGSTQAKMYSFFASTRNFHEYDVGKLSQMISRFWASFQIWKRSAAPEQVEAALRLFQIPCEGDLQKLGSKGLRERYLTIAMERHPDRGGEGEAFLLLKDGYNVLRQRLELKRVS